MFRLILVLVNSQEVTAIVVSPIRLLPGSCKRITSM